MMTPNEYAEYKTKWMKNSFPVYVHKDCDIQGKGWCRRNLSRQSWSFKPNTNVNEHTFYFEDEGDAEMFTRHFKAY